jgi:DNA (cytosine-5)-methyltransferase 1
MTHGSLFSGIGGADLAAQWAGWTNVFQVEIDPWCQQLLAKRFPETDKHLDVKQFDGTQYKGAVDVISGGFPCQPYSTAGKRLGKEDDRHLWPDMLRVIREVQPRYVVGENVRGLVTWNGGLVFDEVQADLEASGYEVLPFLLPACSINAPHRRDRIWFVAYANSHGQHQRNGQHEVEPSKGGEYAQRNVREGGSDGPNTHAESTRLEGARGQELQGRNDGLAGICENDGYATDTDSDFRRKRRMHQEQSQNAKSNLSTRNAPRDGRYTWHDFPSESPVCRTNDGLPKELDKHRVQRLKGLGNAWVPQLAYRIFQVINTYDANYEAT